MTEHRGHRDHRDEHGLPRLHQQQISAPGFHLDDGRRRENDFKKGHQKSLHDAGGSRKPAAGKSETKPQAAAEKGT